MQQFKKYIGRKIVLKNIKNKEKLNSYGILCRYQPDPPEDFDEFEFTMDWDDDLSLAIMVTIEHLKVVRMFWGLFPMDDPDVMRPLTEVQQDNFLEEKGDLITEFFRFIIKE